MQKKKCLRVISDVHGHLKEYVDLVSEVEYSLQVGDMGFSYDYINQHLDPVKHRILGGNHDNYTKELCVCKNGCEKCENRGYIFTKLSPHFLSDYGVWDVPGFGPIFYVRGAWSIDKDWRVNNVSWWEDEELTYAQCVNAIAKYEELKPKFVVTHTVPESIIPQIPFSRAFGDDIHGSRTEKMLDNMYEIHQPETWIFGHWHTGWRKEIEHPKTSKKTEFICLPELGSVDFLLTENKIEV